MPSYPRIVSKDPERRTCFAAEGRVLGEYFQIGVTFDAAAAAPVRHETIKEALLDRARVVMKEAEAKGRYDWPAHGFERRERSDDESGHPTFWLRSYSELEICELI